MHFLEEKIENEIQCAKALGSKQFLYYPTLTNQLEGVKQNHS